MKTVSEIIQIKRQNAKAAFATTILILVMSLFGHSQQILSPQVIACTGGFSSAAGSISQQYTIGEMTMVQTFSAGGTILTQGFEQPLDNITGLLNLTADAGSTFIAYPVPAVDNVWLGYEFEGAGYVTVDLLSISAQKLAVVASHDYAGGKITETANLSAFASGAYLLAMNYTNSKSGQKTTITRRLEIIR